MYLILGCQHAFCCKKLVQLQLVTQEQNLCIDDDIVVDDDGNPGAQSP